MALVEATLKSNLLNLFNAMNTAPMSEADYAAKLAKIINDHIKTAAVTVKAGIAVSTPTGPGATSAPGTGSLS
jgi:translation initiation factor 2 alpha subunit (eIF-2alpha)